MSGSQSQQENCHQIFDQTERMLVKGSGEEFTANRAVALAPWVVSARPPPDNPAARRVAASKLTKAEAMRTAPAGTRIKVWIVSQTLSTHGILSATNSTRKSAPASPRTQVSASGRHSAGSCSH